MWGVSFQLILITIIIQLACPTPLFASYNPQNYEIEAAAAAVITKLGLRQQKIPAVDPFNNTINNDTVSTDPKDVKFYLYNNPQNTSEYFELFINDTDTLTLSTLRPDLPLKLLTHGFLSGPANIYPQNVKNASLTKNVTTGSQILVVGWGALSTIVNQDNPINLAKAYIAAALTNVPIVGTRVGQLLAFLVQNNKTSLDKIHLVGHSLGSHVSGVAANFIKKFFGQPVARISGLDPAGPLFYSYVMGRPLTQEDAAFVDILHTDEGTLGKMGRVGHADFHPEGGTMIQAECRNATYFGLLEEILSLGTCSHSEAHMLFARSLGSTALIGCRCWNYFFFKAGWCPCSDGNVAILGDNCDTSARGDFYLEVKPWMHSSV